MLLIKVVLIMNKLDRINGRIQRIKEERKELLKSVKNDLTSEKK